MKNQDNKPKVLFSIGEVQLRYLPRRIVVESRRITQAQDAANIFRQYYDEGELLYREIFLAMFLNRSNDVISIVRISEGGISGTVADNKLIFSAALLSGCSSLIVCHNHPSGNLTPSKADEALTRKIKSAAESFDMSLLDHIILTKDSHYSFANEGQL